HMGARPDGRALGIIGAPEAVPDLSVLTGRRVLVVDGDRARMRSFAGAALDAAAEVEWINDDHPPLDRLASWALPVGAVVLAAGRASRMGSNKLLLDAGGKPLVCHVVEAASEGGCHFVTVVYADESVREAVGDQVRLVYNPNAATGMASSLRAGLENQRDEVAAALVMLG